MKKSDNNSKNQPNDSIDSSRQTRRRVLKTGGFVVSAGAVLDKWTKPVVDSVLLPAHAQSSAVLIGPVLSTIGAAAAPTRVPAARFARAGSPTSPLDIVIPVAHAIALTYSPTPSPTPPTPSPTPPTPAPTPGTPSPTVTVAPTPSPTGCPAIGQCVSVSAPDAQGKVSFSISNVGSGLLNMTPNTLLYSGIVAGLSVSGFFTDLSYTNTQGTVTGLGCNASFHAQLNGSCTPVALGP